MIIIAMSPVVWPTCTLLPALNVSMGQAILARCSGPATTPLARRQQLPGTNCKSLLITS